MIMIKFITKKIREHHAKRFIKDESDKKLLDIGCGDKSFINSLKHINAIGIDIKYDQDAEKGLNYKEETFDYITLLAVIEHFHDYRKVIKDCHRVLKNNGLLIMTTPFRKTERFIRLYQKGDIGHIGYFSRKDFNRLNKFRLIHYSTFEFGLNQLIVLKKG